MDMDYKPNSHKYKEEQMEASGLRENARAGLFD